MREDYSPYGNCWDYFPHDHARSRAYRWGEDGLLGFTDRECRLCFGLALWNGRDPILKERLFGLTGPEGNHGEDVKENYYYLDATPTYSYAKALYKYPQGEFPYQQLVQENRHRGLNGLEYELERYRNLQRESLFRYLCRIRQSRTGRFADSHKRCKPWTRSHDDSCFANALVSQYVELGFARGAIREAFAALRKWSSPTCGTWLPRQIPVCLGERG